MTLLPHRAHGCLALSRVYQMLGSSTIRPSDPPAPLYKLRPCPSYSVRRDRINLVPNLIRYKCSAAT